MIRGALSLVVAMTSDRVIGRGGDLPGHLPEDLKRFRRITTGHAIIMGRRTHASSGRALPNRRNIVVTRQSDAAFEGCEVAHGFEDAVALARTSDEAPRVIGGASLYRAALPHATRLYVTEVHLDVTGDTHFPPFDRTDWREVEREEGDRVTYHVYDRVGAAPGL